MINRRLRRLVWSASLALLFGAIGASRAAEAQQHTKLSGLDRAFVSWDSQIERAQQNMGAIAERRSSSAALREIGKSVGEANEAPLGAVHVAVEHRYDTMPSDQFDAQFIHHEIRDHQYFLEHFRAEAAKRANPDLKGYATHQIPVLQMHPAAAEALARRTDSGGHP
jgi:hypothetical protein